MHNYADQINWEDFYIALNIARCGSFMKAAAQLGIHHTTVARRLDRLEKQLTTQLFYRHTRGVELTAAGQEMLLALSQVQADLQHLGARLHGHNTTLAGSLRITTLVPFWGVLAPHLQEFRHRYPRIDFELILEERGLSLSQGEADIALRAGSIGAEDMVVPIKIADMYVALYGAKTYFQSHTPPERLEDLKTHQYVMLTRYPPSFTWFDWLAEQVPEPQTGILLNHPQGISAAVKAGFGLGFLSYLEASHDDSLQLAWPAQERWKSPLWLLVHRDRYREAKIQAFIQFFKSVIQPAMRAELAYQDAGDKGPVL